MIALDLYDVQGQSKRFFDEASVRPLFGGCWEFLSFQEMTSDKYGATKVLWEAVLVS